MRRKRVRPVVTAQELRDAAGAALRLSDFLEKANQAGVVDLMGFDLDWLSEQFDIAADVLETRQ